MSKAPIKKCDYCGNEGVMPTLMSGETVCLSCMGSMPSDMQGMRKELTQLREALARAEGERDAANMAKDSVLGSYERWKARAEAAEQERDTLKAERERLAMYESVVKNSAEYQRGYDEGRTTSREEGYRQGWHEALNGVFQINGPSRAIVQLRKKHPESSTLPRTTNKEN